MPRHTPPRIVCVLSENWTIVAPHDLRALVRMAVEAEDAGVDAVMVSEHIVLGPSAGENGVMGNPRDYALPGNQDPAMPWPHSLTLLAGIAAATTTIRLAAAAVIVPLRHPLLMARELGTLDLLAEGRLVVQPTVSWHRDEYDALGVAFNRRGALLDEQLAAWDVLWRDTPASFEGRFHSFEDVYLEPKAFRPEGPRLWFGGEHLHPRLLRRLVEHGSGFHPLGRPTAEDMAVLATAMTAAGRDLSQLEMIGGIRGDFPDDRSVADLDRAMDSMAEQVDAGFTAICFKPSQYTDDPRAVASLCRRMVARAEAITS
jgi:alkanesulfonate monooxygenase SsuD/methylene tetrahydromethanopterin reductase-like flavin-dependent oxidoreductase (luciferase family)